MCPRNFCWLRNVGLFWLWPVLPPVAILSIASSLLPEFAHTDLPVGAPIWEAGDIVGAEATARFWVATTYLFLIVICVAATAIAASIVWRSLSGQKRSFSYGFAILLAVVSFFIVNPGPRLWAYLGEELFEKTIGAYPNDTVGLVLLERMFPVSNVIGIFAAVFIAVAVAALAPETTPKPSGLAAPEARRWTDEALGRMAAHVRDLKYLLFVAAAVLFIALLHSKAWHEWPLAFWPPDTPSSDKAAFQAIVTASVNYQASYFVLILAAIFVPMAVRLRAAARTLAAQDEAVGNSPAAQERWLAANGITLSLGQQAQRLFAIISPFFAAPAAGLLKTVTDLMQSGG